MKKLLIILTIIMMFSVALASEESSGDYITVFEGNESYKVYLDKEEKTIKGFVYSPIELYDISIPSGEFVDIELRKVANSKNNSYTPVACYHNSTSLDYGDLTIIHRIMFEPDVYREDDINIDYYHFDDTKISSFINLDKDLKLYKQITLSKSGTFQEPSESDVIKSIEYEEKVDILYIYGNDNFISKSTNPIDNLKVYARVGDTEGFIILEEGSYWKDGSIYYDGIKTNDRNYGYVSSSELKNENTTELNKDIDSKKIIIDNSNNNTLTIALCIVPIIIILVIILLINKKFKQF